MNIDCHFDEYTIDNETLSNPFPNKQVDLLNDMRTRYADIINQLINFDDDIKKLNELIADFQKSLQSVIDNSVVGLKGSCPIENQLNYMTKLKSFLHLSR